VTSVFKSEVFFIKNESLGTRVKAQKLCGHFANRISYLESCIIGWIELSLEIIHSYEITQVKLQLPNKWCEIFRNKDRFCE
jgi:hypothetical protein